MEIFSIRLEKALLDSHISQTELADRLGIGKASVNGWLKGLYIPNSIAKVRSIAGVLGVNPGWLMGFIDDSDLKVLRIMTNLNAEGRTKVLEYLEDLEINPKYTEQKREQLKVDWGM